MKYTETIILDKGFRELGRFGRSHEFIEHYFKYQTIDWSIYYPILIWQFVSQLDLTLDDIYIKVQVVDREEMKVSDFH